MINEHIARLEEAAQDTKTCQRLLAEAKAKLAHAQRLLTTRRNALILQGLEGKNAAEREAWLQRETAAEMELVAGAEASVAAKQLAYDQERIDWTLVRELAPLVLAATA
ncbi:MAG: hypothetical protein AAF267_17600 [Deinococcota bacterium]